MSKISQLIGTGRPTSWSTLTGVSGLSNFDAQEDVLIKAGYVAEINS